MNWNLKEDAERARKIMNYPNCFKLISKNSKWYIMSLITGKIIKYLY